MQQENTALIDAVNGALERLIADGTYQTDLQEVVRRTTPPKEFQPSS